MGIVKRWSNFYSENVVFDFLRDHSYEEVSHWVYSVANGGVIETDFITLEDDRRRSDEGNLTEDILTPFEEKELLEKLREIRPDKIVFIGKYKRSKLIFCFNLALYLVGVSMEKDHPVDAERLEKDLKLDR